VWRNSGEGGGQNHGLMEGGCCVKRQRRKIKEEEKLD